MKFLSFIFLSLIGNEEGLSVYELHIAVKDHCFGFGREDQIVGVAVMQLKDIENQVIIVNFYFIFWLPPNKSQKIKV